MKLCFVCRVGVVLATPGSENQAPSMVPFTGDSANFTGTRSGAVDVVIAQLPGGRSMVQLARVEVGASERAVRIELGDDRLPRRSIRGRLVDDVLAAVAGETVSVRRIADDGLAVVVATPSAADGGFEVGPLPPGRYSIVVGELRSPVVVGTAQLTAARDEDVGDLRVPKR